MTRAAGSAGDGAGGSFDLTVYSIGVTSAADCRVAVESLAEQTIADRLEVLVLSPDPAGIDDAVTTAFAAYRHIPGLSIRDAGSAMAAAVRAARAPYVVYAEEHATFAPDWAERLLAAHVEGGHDVVGFAMENANPDTAVSWAHLYGQFGPVVAPVEPGLRPKLAGHHVSYARTALLEYGDLMETVLEDENVLFVDYRERGRTLYLAGDAVSPHINISRLSALMALDFNGQRSFGAGRARVGGWPWWKRAVWAAACPLVPLVRMRRSVRDVLRSGRARLLPRILGPMTVMFVAGAVGEALGYLVGEGTAPERKVPPEFQRRDFTVEGGAARDA